MFHRRPNRQIYRLSPADEIAILGALPIETTQQLAERFHVSTQTIRNLKRAAISDEPVRDQQSEDWCREARERRRTEEIELPTLRTSAQLLEEFIELGMMPSHGRRTNPSLDSD